MIQKIHSILTVLEDLSYYHFLSLRTMTFCFPRTMMFFSMFSTIGAVRLCVCSQPQLCSCGKYGWTEDPLPYLLQQRKEYEIITESRKDGTKMLLA